MSETIEGLKTVFIRMKGACAWDKRQIHRIAEVYDISLEYAKEQWFPAARDGDSEIVELSLDGKTIAATVTVTAEVSIDYDIEMDGFINLKSGNDD